MNKRLIKNNKLLSDLLEKERGYQDKEDESGNEANDENLSDSSEEEETSSENSQPEESHNSGLESDWEEEAVCPICDHKIPLGRKHAKKSLRRCYDCGAITHKDERISKMRFYPPSDEEDKDD